MLEGRERLLAYALLIIGCGLADWALTVDGLRAGFISEANPIGQWMLAQGPVLSLLIKLAVTVPSTMLLVALAHRSRVAYYGLVVTAWVFFALVVWHVIGRVIVYG
jgi:hypothetical protein